MFSFAFSTLRKISEIQFEVTSCSFKSDVMIVSMQVPGQQFVGIEVNDVMYEATAYKAVNIRLCASELFFNHMILSIQQRKLQCF